MTRAPALQGGVEESHPGSQPGLLCPKNQVNISTVVLCLLCAHVQGPRFNHQQDHPKPFLGYCEGRDGNDRAGKPSPLSSVRLELDWSSHNKRETLALITNFICPSGSQFLCGASHHISAFKTVTKGMGGLAVFVKEPDLLKFWLELSWVYKSTLCKLTGYLHF